MASPQETDLCYAWEKYMDCRLQGADLQVWRFWQECNVRDHSLGGGAAYFLQEQVLKKDDVIVLGKGLKTAMYLVYSDGDKLFVFNHYTVAKPVLSRISFKGLSRYEVSVLSTLE